MLQRTHLSINRYRVLMQVSKSSPYAPRYIAYRTAACPLDDVLRSRVEKLGQKKDAKQNVQGCAGLDFFSLYSGAKYPR